MIYGLRSLIYSVCFYWEYFKPAATLHRLGEAILYLNSYLHQYYTLDAHYNLIAFSCYLSWMIYNNNPSSLGTYNYTCFNFFFALVI